MTVMCDNGYTYSDVTNELYCQHGVWTSRPGTCIPNAQGKFELYKLTVMFASCYIFFKKILDSTSSKVEKTDLLEMFLKFIKCHF